MSVLFIDSIHWCDVGARDPAFDFPAQPLATIERALVQQRLFAGIDGALRWTRKCSEGVQHNGPQLGASIHETASLLVQLLMAKVEKTLEVRRILHQRRPRRVEFLAADVQLHNARSRWAILVVSGAFVLLPEHGAAPRAFAATTLS